ncbi:MAG TPA: dihydrofolate reductase family protein [Dehalococcoidia bacterium]|nr:dihydrofolate reductase family protein [Dehalococcoidia bacterium]
MRKLKTWNMLSLDGFFEGPSKGEIEWFVFDDELEKFILDTQLNAGALLFGRVTYEMMAGYWPTADGAIADFMNSVPKVVFSRTLEKTDWNNTTLVKDNAVAEVQKLKEQPGNDIFVFGSADFSQTLMQNALIDEYHFGINPVVIGKGVPWFKGGYGTMGMELFDSKRLKSGLILLFYRPR